MDSLKEFAKRFSIIDVLAFYLPGAIYILSTLYLFGEKARDAFFDPLIMTFEVDNAYLRGVYFSVIAYVVGFVLDEMSKCLYNLCGKVLSRMHLVKSKAKEHDADYEADVQKMAVFPVSESYRKQQLFSGFNLLCRGLISTILLMLFEICILDNGVGWIRQQWYLLFLAVALIFLLGKRAAYFAGAKDYYLDVCLCTLNKKTDS